MPWSTKTTWGRRAEHRQSFPAPSGPTLLRIDGPIHWSGLTTWWGKRWCEALERAAASERLSQGRWHARQGRVAWLEVKTDGVVARVEGGNAMPRTVTVRLRQFTAAQWERLLDTLATQAGFGAALLNGELPRGIEAEGVSVVPMARDDAFVTCPCSEGRRDLCKHILAVWYVLAELVDADPFLLFLFRGRAKADVLEALRDRRAQASRQEVPSGTSSEQPAGLVDAAAFWRMSEDADLSTLPAGAPDTGLSTVPASPVQRLGPPPFWQGPADFEALMVEAYAAVSRQAEAVRDGRESEQVSE